MSTSVRLRPSRSPSRPNSVPPSAPAHEKRSLDPGAVAAHVGMPRVDGEQFRHEWRGHERVEMHVEAVEHPAEPGGRARLPLQGGDARRCGRGGLPPGHGGVGRGMTGGRRGGRDGSHAVIRTWAGLMARCFTVSPVAGTSGAMRIARSMAPRQPFAGCRWATPTHGQRPHVTRESPAELPLTVLSFPPCRPWRAPPGTWPAPECAAMSTDEGLRSHARLVQNLPNSRYASTGSRPLRIAARTLSSVAMTASTSATTSAAISAGTTTTPSQSATT